MVPSFNYLKKNLKKNTANLPIIKLAILADTASQMLVTAIKGYGIEQGVFFDVFEADYNQIDLQVFDPSSALYECNPDFIFICRSAEHLLTEFYKKEHNGQQVFAADQIAYTDHLYQQIKNRLNAKIIVTSFAEINDAVFGNYAAKTTSSFPFQIKKLNVELMQLSQQRKDLFICDIAALVTQKGYENCFDVKPYINADMVFSIDFLPFIAKHVFDIVSAVKGNFKKCVILDLDNTLWGGIIGDDGLEGIQIGGLGLGKAFTNLQLWIKELRKRGIILAVSSKNTESVAKEPFEKHPEMILRMDDIAVFAANWETKVDNIRYIQSILNIAFSSMVFLDDNPFERGMVKEAIPELTVPELPEDPSEYVAYLRSLNLFETASFTAEDESRTKQYQEEAKRTALFKSFENEDEFLQSLNMTATVKPFNDFTVPRIAQLSQRSNQFNLRTVRYTEEDIAKLAADENYYSLSFDLNDRYGDYGLIGFIILKKINPDTLFIDSWVMSCRVLKRGMEHFMLQQVIELAKSNGFTSIEAEYIPTAKNALVKEHYQKLHFTQIKDNYFELNTEAPVALKHFITKN